MAQERRAFPRVDTEHSLQLLDADGAAFPALMLDLSLAGMQLLCDGPTALRLAGREGEEPREFDVRLQVTLPRHGARQLRMRCRLMTIREVQQDEFRIGVRFTQFEADSYPLLEAWIDETLPD